MFMRDFFFLIQRNLCIKLTPFGINIILSDLKFYPIYPFSNIYKKNLMDEYWLEN